MNQIGNILVVTILILSIIFMTLAVVVYATHTNWRTTAEALEEEVGTLTTQVNQSQEQYNRLDLQLKGEIEAAQQQLRKLETERDRLVQSNTAIQAELDQLRQERRDATAAVASTQQNNERLAADAESLRQTVRENEVARNEAFTATLNATEQRNQVVGQLETALEQNRALMEQVAGMSTVMREQGLDPATDPAGVTPRVAGRVIKTRREGGTLYVEISIGADDGLKPKHTVELYRGDKYLGRAEILSTSPDKAVARVDRRFQQGSIQEGDSVATRLELS